MLIGREGGKVQTVTQYEKLIQSIRKGIGSSLPRYTVERLAPKIADALIADGVVVGKEDEGK